MASSLIAALLLGAPSVFATPLDLHPYMDPVAYDNGDFGSYPIENYVSSNLTGPRLGELAGVPEDDGLYTVMSPRGHQVKQRGPMILDHYGNLVWLNHDYDEVYAMMIQEYNGDQYITFWSGNDGIGGHGAGIYIILDSTYKEVRRYNAGGGLEGDLHEFRFTDHGTALVTAYQVVGHDLRSLGKQKDGWIWDCVFQELDIATGNVLFEWRASKHYLMTDSFKGIGEAGHKEGPYDFFHMNSVEKDKLGNYLVSSRYMHSVTYIDGKTGDVIWILGGKQNKFKDLSDGAATNFSWQHDARWHDDLTSITLFDNGAEPGIFTAEYSRGLYLGLDVEKMEVRLIQSFNNPQNLISSSQGGVQMLPNGNVLVSYGYTPVYTEFDKNGTVLRDVHYGSKLRFETGDVQSYRVMKFPWVGRPPTPPAFATWGRRGYVSWNGATEVKTWRLQQSNVANGRYTDVTSFRKRGFETSVDLDIAGQRVGPFLRVVGLDVDGTVLGTSEPVEFSSSGLLEGVTSYGQLPGSATGGNSILLLFLVAGLCVLSFFVGAFLTGGVATLQRLRTNWMGYRPLSTRAKDYS